MKYHFVIIKKINDKWWYHGADRNLDLASRTLFNLGKIPGSYITDGRIVELKDPEQLERLRKTVNNLPASL